jgi:hypothetical protein
LVPHDVQEGIKREVVVSPGETGKSPKNGAGHEDAMQMLLEASQLLFHILKITNI